MARGKDKIKRKSKYDNVFTAGQQFGGWTVLDSALQVGGAHGAFVLCRCLCGSEKPVAAQTLVKGMTTRCGECRRIATTEQTGAKNPSWRGIGAIPGSKFKHVKDPDTRQLLAGLWDSCDKHCALTGVPLDMKTTASPDRIDSSKGYIEGNVQWVHKDVNLMKNAFNVDYFTETCRKIAEKHPRK